MGRGTGVRAASRTSIQIDLKYRGQRCRESLRLDPSVISNCRFVENLKKRIEYEIITGTFDYANHFPDSRRARKFALNPSQVVTVGELLTEWLKHIPATVEPETYADYSEYVNNIWRPLFGLKRVTELTLKSLYEWVATQKSSKKRILNVLTPLRQAYRYAVEPAKLLKVKPPCRNKD